MCLALTVHLAYDINLANFSMNSSALFSILNGPHAFKVPVCGPCLPEIQVSQTISHACIGKRTAASIYFRSVLRISLSIT